MRSNVLMFCLISFYIVTGCSSRTSCYRFTLRGEMDGMKYGKMFLYKQGDSRHPLDSAEVSGGKFVLKTAVPEPGKFTIQVNRKSLICYLDGEEMFLKGNYDSFSKSKLEGSPANDLDKKYQNLLDKYVRSECDSLLREYRKAFGANDVELGDRLMTRILQLENEVQFQLTEELVRENPNSIFSAHISTLVLGGSYEKGKKLYDLLGSKARASSWGVALKQRVEELERTAIGKNCPDFEMTGVNGEKFMMSSLLGSSFKNSLVIIDFWASWCGPCRQEMKSLMERYKEFNGRGVQFLSISIDDSEKKWKEAYKEEGFPWLSAWDEKGWNNSKIREIFGITQIPFIILLDKDGKIAAKNIRRNTLREKIVELLNQ